MVFRRPLTTVTTVVATLALVLGQAHSTENEKRILDPVCEQVASSISSASAVWYPGHPLYVKGILHWASSSAQLAKCVVEPGTPADVGIILGVVGSTRTPFAVKGGGHSANPKFSSTTGVLIAMSRFSEVTYDAASQTAVVGAGLIWDDVYRALAPSNVNVLGGRVTGVGVAGFTLGGGYSWKSNQYGLTIDSVAAFELVKPNGTVTPVTATSDSRLFSALKGGLNNFGIVTRFTLKTFPQGPVWGGLITFTEPHIPAVAAAIANFSSLVTDPKASIITASNAIFSEPGISQLLFYDGPTPPPGIFDAFLAIPPLTKDVSTRDFLSLVLSSPANATYGQRAIFNTVSLVNYAPNMLDTILNETSFWGKKLSPRASFVSYDIEPFLPSLFSHSSSSSAYPPDRSRALLPLNIYYAWLDDAFDSEFQDAARQSAAHIYNVAIADGQNIAGAALYPNYAIFDTPLANMYGSNVGDLQSLKATVDPTNIMGLAGGFKF